jgi:hypothetical protein
MEDIDLLVRPGTLTAARQALAGMGYEPAPEDPFAMRHSSKGAPVDIADGIWYLDKAGTERIFDDSIELKGFYGAFSRLRAEDLYIHVLAHGAVHHAEVSAKWKEDLLLIKENWGGSMDWEEVGKKLKLYGFERAAEVYLSGRADTSFYGRLLSSAENPLKGHVSRFACLPAKKKAAYLAAALFPSKEFLEGRYNLKSASEVFFYRMFRPFLLLANLASFARRLLP